MHPLNNGSQVENVPAPKPRVGTAGYFSESNDGGSPSYPGQDWFNAVIREFQNALAASGVSFDPDKFDHLPKVIAAISQTSAVSHNRLVANQNFNVPGKSGHPVPSSTVYTYPAGEEIVAGILALTECTVTRSAGVLSGMGVYRRVIQGEFPNDYFGVKLTNGTQTNSGVSLTPIGGVTYVDVDLAQAGPHLFPGSSEFNGKWQSVGDDISRKGFIVPWWIGPESNSTTINFPDIPLDAKSVILSASAGNSSGGFRAEFFAEVPIEHFLSGSRINVGNVLFSTEVPTDYGLVRISSATRNSLQTDILTGSAGGINSLLDLQVRF